MSNLSEELIRKSLNATLSTCGSVATSIVAADIGAATAYTGGMFLKNCEVAGGIRIWISTTTTAVADSATSFPLDPGEIIPLSVGNLATISAIAASGTPRLAWVGNTL